MTGYIAQIKRFVNSCHCEELWQASNLVLVTYELMRKARKAHSVYYDRYCQMHRTALVKFAAKYAAHNDELVSEFNTDLEASCDGCNIPEQILDCYHNTVD